MSHAQATKDQEAAYISVGGSMSDKQRELLAGALAKAHERGAEVIVATDNDLAGNKLAREITAMAPAGAAVNRDVPKHGKDWNEQVQYQRGDENSYSMGM
jgi:5S rRNA maturation endonuclease (ribonuclease M5)